MQFYLNIKALLESNFIFLKKQQNDMNVVKKYVIEMSSGVSYMIGLQLEKLL